MTRILTTTLLICGTLMATALQAQAQAQTEASPLTLFGAMKLALEENYGVQLARLRSESAAINDSWGAAGALPSIGLSTSGSSTVADQSENPTSFIQEKLEAESFNLGGQLNWTLFDGLGMFANKRSLALLADQSAGEVDLMVEQTSVAVTTAYTTVVVQDSLIASLEASMALSRDRLAWLEVREATGAAGTFDALQFENALLNDSAAWLRQQVARRTALRNLNRIMGQPETTDWQLTTPLLPLDAATERFADPDAVVREAAQDATTVRNALLTEALAETGLDQAQARLYPVLGLNVNLGDVRSQFAAGELSGEGRTKNQGATLTLNFNLFNGGATKRAIEQARIQQDIAATNRMNEAMAVAQLVRDALDRYATQEALYDLAQQSTRNAEALLEVAKQRYEFGAINSFNYRDLQLAALQARVRQLQELQAWHQAHWEVQRLTGALRMPLQTGESASK